ncbi:MAG: MFS transporter [Chloroflexi bacterium]|nr:MFS transporter [Chloroflexota bacterium]
MDKLLRMYRGLFYGWKVLAAASWLRALGGGFHVLAFSILFLPVSRDLNLSRTAASLIFSLSRAEGAMEGPFVGHFIDRFGARIMVTIGCVTIGVGYLLLSRVYDFASFVLVYILVISVGYGTAFVHSTGALATQWFYRHRALSLAVVGASVSLGGALFAPLFALVVHQFGWRVGAIVSGAVFLAAGLPVTRVIYSTPEDKGLTPLGALKPAAATPQVEPKNAGEDDSSDFTARQAMRSGGFWLLVTAAFLRTFGNAAISLHFIPILTWKGVPEQTAAYYLGAVAAFGVPVHIILGLAGDRWYKPRVLSLGMALGMAGALFLLYGGKKAPFLFIPLLAVVDSVFSVIWATLGDFYGRRQFATIRGFLTLFATIGAMLGPVFAGMVYDRTGGYTLAIQVFAFSFALSAVGFWVVRRPGKRAV